VTEGEYQLILWINEDIRGYRPMHSKSVGPEYHDNSGSSGLEAKFTPSSPLHGMNHTFVIE